MIEFRNKVFRLIALLFFSVLVVGCKSDVRELTKINPGDFCSYPADFISRCENDEVICYKYHEGGLQCKWKTPTQVNR